MTDYAKPATPAEACRRLVDELEFKATRLRQQAEILLARAQEVDEAAMDVRAEALRYEQHQPKPAEADRETIKPNDQGHDYACPTCPLCADDRVPTQHWVHADEALTACGDPRHIDRSGEAS